MYMLFVESADLQAKLTHYQLGHWLRFYNFVDYYISTKADFIRTIRPINAIICLQLR